MQNLSIHLKKEIGSNYRRVFASLDHESKYKIVWEFGNIENSFWEVFVMFTKYINCKN